uniref:Uncharacterized protein n=1 Tax=Astyanax mexicanus TaxID=7994 RepID=A0A8B9KRB2_ASTMX
VQFYWWCISSAEVQVWRDGNAFRYATCPEVLLMLIALVCSAIHGAALPIMCIVFGSMTDSFVQSGQQFNFTGMHSSYALFLLISSLSGLCFTN